MYVCMYAFMYLYIFESMVSSMECMCMCMSVGFVGFTVSAVSKVSLVRYQKLIFRISNNSSVRGMLD
jgi:hypothetical protein